MRLSSVVAPLLALSSAVGVVSAVKPTRTTRQSSSQFITVGADGQFMKNGEPFRFIGTNAYWLPSLESDTDIQNTLHNIASKGIKVVRTWAFNDVTTIPENGTWFQLIANGTTSVNTGPNGLQRLDAVVSAAEKEGISLIMSLTNNWNPQPLTDGTPLVPVSGNARRDVTVGTGNDLPRNTLSNDYGGMDAYVREFSVSKNHDEFYQNQSIINIFQNYTDQVVKRYLNSPAILAWELANDARCNSSIAATLTCNTTTVTSWHATVANHVKSVDPNHLVSSGVAGFQCPNCPKLFKPTAPAPLPSGAAGKKKRAVPQLTSAYVLKERQESRKRSWDLKKREMFEQGKGMMIRGRWIAARQTTPNPMDTDLGSAMDGTFGVDSEDIMFIGNIGFGSFQLFPDQNTYGAPDPNLPAINNTIDQGISWIKTNAMVAAGANKPTVLTGFGLVTQNNSGDFVPFNSTIAPFNSSDPAVSGGIAGLPAVKAASDDFGVTNAQQDDAYTQWITAAATAGVSGAVQYQWGQGGLTGQQGTDIVPNSDTTDVVPNAGADSPNDGYQSAPTGSDGVQTTLTSLTSMFGA
ncbi:glycoside hydrolase family 5 protein [Schizopora paradoxa]|uniref:mannan endo-1,4-beta-mannosidase n=1 Tax=Schizopora paradoxa TaxID=27342 RepID=A0A0H2SP13_9AGAM|nr:glycoside hydrolase family 5 protein [Schizopora paradoxa]